MEKQPILKMEHVSISFQQYGRGVRQTNLPVIRDLSVSVGAGEIVAVVGASGSGKSLLAHAVLGILPYNAEQKGVMLYKDEVLDKKRQEKLRGRKIVLVPQSVTYLDPLMKVGTQVCKGNKKTAIKNRMKKVLSRYGLNENVQRMYPFELSGGMARRVLIATADMEEAELVIADEPTPGLDKESAYRTMDYFKGMAEKGAGVLFITHDLELAIKTANRIVIFYAGTTVEETTAEAFQKEETLFHPYTKALWRAMPQHGFLPSAGTQPYVTRIPTGCVYRASCKTCQRVCNEVIPYFETKTGYVRCIQYHKESELRQYE